MNQVVLIGRLTRNPELRYIASTGTAVCRFALAVNREFKKEGQPDADFINIKCFSKTAENSANYLRKGLMTAVTGRMQNNNYEDKNGVKHYGMEVIASRVEFIEWANRNSQNNQHNTQGYQQPSQQHSYNQQSYQQDMAGFQAIPGDDDIPF
ncbi:single-stranded DNA-binding protein [Acidaminobacter sp. JC074]|uniref:single-stranded DNA-binding protein n=1 Tax=Acidaminobacter sp. JC074 TaxID=2530199 RepID=UPI001F0E49C9|nr:single-stranded DNA-binding protein [Acidaminobacter sp. JC074]MCH4891203.1 single-stranded DNA-binding protein [Acidaminobacter sp. JC074]